MPGLSHHFQGKDRSGEVPPWGTEATMQKSKKDTQLTTYDLMFQGHKGVAAKPFRNHTTNHFDQQNWRNKSSYRETFLTPQMYSRHDFQKSSPTRNNRPHPQSLVWPLEPNKGYMIWKPQILPDEEKVKKYSAPSLLRQYNESNWLTTTQTTYQDYFLKGSLNEPVEANKERFQSKNAQRDQLHSNNKSRSSDSRQSKAKSTPPFLRTSYKVSFTGEPMKPSTNAKPIDKSWRHIKY